MADIRSTKIYGILDSVTEEGILANAIQILNGLISANSLEELASLSNIIKSSALVYNRGDSRLYRYNTENGLWKTALKECELDAREENGRLVLFNEVFSEQENASIEEISNEDSEIIIR